MRHALLVVAAVTLLAPACALSSGSSGGTSPPTCSPGVSEPCYSGAPSTRNVGPCRSGVHTCAPDGHGFGACAGEVVPQPEPCGSSEDLDCNGKTGCSGEAVWKLALTGTVEPTGIAASTDGEATVFGWAQTIDIGTGLQGDPSTWSLFVARFGANGTPRWLRTFAGVDPSKHTGSIVMSAAHEATLAIYVEGSVSLDGHAFHASPNGVLAVRFDDAGKVGAARLVDLGGPPATLAPWARVARLAGDGGLLVGGAGFLAHLDPRLSTTWHHRFAGDVTFEDLLFTGSGVFAAGSYVESFDPGGGAQAVAGNHAGFVAQLDGPQVMWSETLGGDVETTAVSVTTEPDGTLEIGGTQAGGGSLIQHLGITGSTGFVAYRLGDGMIQSSFLGWGPRTPATMTRDASGDLTIRAVGVDEWSPTVLFKSLTAGSSPYWVKEFQWPPVSVTLPSGETILATAKGVQKLGR